MTIHPTFPEQVHDAQQEALREENLKDEALRGMKKQLEARSNSVQYFMKRIWVPKFGELRKAVLDEAHKSKYSIHPGSDKMYHDIKGLYWWPNMKAEIAKYVS